MSNNLAQKPKGMCDYCFLVKLSNGCGSQGYYLLLDSLPTSANVYYIGKHSQKTYKLAYCMDRTPRKCQCKEERNPSYERDFQKLFKVSV